MIGDRALEFIVAYNERLHYVRFSLTIQAHHQWYAPIHPIRPNYCGIRLDWTFLNLPVRNQLVPLAYRSSGPKVAQTKMYFPYRAHFRPPNVRRDGQ